MKKRLHMKGKVIFLWVALTALICFIGGSTAVMAGDLPKSKLGYGFEKGLIAGKDYVSGQLIVGIKEGVGIQDISQAAQASGGKVAKSIKGAILLDFTSEQAAKDAVKKLIDRSDVTFIERNGFMSIPPTPVLPDLKSQKKIKLSMEDLNASSLSSETVSSESMSALSVSTDPGTGYQWHHTVIRKTADLGTLSTTPPTVAVIDTGVDYTHPDLSGKVSLGKNCIADNNDPFDDNGHGTHVAGIIAAKSANGKYGEGVCPNCKILAIKVLGSDGAGTFFDVACGMQNARTKSTTPATKVINMSLGGPSSALVSTEVDAIKAAGKVLVAAAGNDNTKDITNAYPGADPDTALRVMANEDNDCRAWFSNFSPGGNPTQYNIAAPGWQILSTLPEAGYGAFSGTSQASPIVAGAAALVWGQSPSLTRDGVVSEYKVPAVIMHIRGTPRDMQQNPVYEALIPEIMDYLRTGMIIARQAEISEDKIIIDPGIGFGKTYEQNLEIINNLHEFKPLNKPILIGPSRKAFIGKILGDVPVTERLEGTAAAVAISIMNGANIIRAHDVKEMVKVAKVADAIT